MTPIQQAILDCAALAAAANTAWPGLTPAVNAGFIELLSDLEALNVPAPIVPAAAAHAAAKPGGVK